MSQNPDLAPIVYFVIVNTEKYEPNLNLKIRDKDSINYYEW